VKLYLETSVPNMLFKTQAPEKVKITERLNSICFSELYINEVRKTQSPFLRYQLEGIVKVYNAEVLMITDEMRKVADAYVSAKAFTELNSADALHVAVAVCSGCDAVVSWNFRHIARAWTIKKVGEVNHQLGLPEVVICTPEEVIGGEE
jgi:predicted nucleic acid-binding protein